ncbi:hypothetical protein [Catellatospora chokoriensis]|uniref:Uncharacterized protein n=1 Tax=Catellatospora chokoriensis TaxID=310353 RepID=A0A8J3K7J2_9ACTN|nr:hypothetical protein [Catellatospora chokoriensis]GIF91653.1 hypothetical protein Cch02nite_50970 [Catellatospora chokoriensis]
MPRSLIKRRAVAAVGVAVAASALLMAAAAPAMAYTAKEFTGGGRGLTAASAIQAAAWDAEASASAEQLNTCVRTGEPGVWEVFDHPYFGHVFFAEVTVSCTP